MISIVTGATIGNANGVVAAWRFGIWIIFSVAVNTPAHVKLGGYFHLVHFRNISVALCTVKAPGNVNLV